MRFGDGCAWERGTATARKGFPARDARIGVTLASTGNATRCI